MDVVSELRTDRGPHCGMKGSHTLQTLEEVRREAPVSSPRTSTRKITIGPQTNSTKEIETETTLRGGDSPMEIESLPETKFGNTFALQIEPLPETKFAGIESLPDTSPETKAGEAFGIDIAVSPEMRFGEPSTKENEATLDTSFGGDSALEIEAPPVKIFSSLIISEDSDEGISKGAQREEMKEDPFPSHIGSRNAVDLSREEEKEKEKHEPFGERFPPDDLNKNMEVKTVVLEATSTTPPDSKLTLMEGSFSETLDPKLTSLDSKLILMEGNSSEPLDPKLTSLDSKLALMEGSSSEPLDPELTSLVSKLALMDGSSSEPLDPNLTLKKESSSRSLDSNLPPKKQSSSRSLDSKLTLSMIRRRNRVSATVLERMQQDPLLAEHFAQLETPTTEPISEFSSNGCEPRRSPKSTNRLKCTTDSVGIKYVNQYIVIKVLGRGTFGKVKLCLNTMDCKLYAVKILYRKSVARHSHWGTRDDVGKRALREIAIMKKLNHPNVVALIEVIDDPSNRKLYLVLEYVEGGPIMVNDLWHPIPEEKARLYFRDMCKGLDYLHFNKIVHRDLKPGNLLQTMDGRIKISDFGVSHMLDHESDSIHGTAGTPAFLAPEICSGGECQGRAADIWALGVCLYVMVYGEIPFPAETVADMYKCIIDEKSLIMTKDPASRISLASIMQHDWVSNQGTEPLIPFKLQKTRVSTAMAVSEAEVKAAVIVKQFGLAALSNAEPVEKHFEPGEYIIRQGEEGQEMYLINSGECEVLVESRSLTQPSRGRMEYAIAERGPGQYVGEMALSTDTTKKPPKRTASIRAKTHVVTLVVSRDQVIEALSKNSEAAKSIADTIAERDQEMRRRMKDLELRLPSFRPSSFRHTTERESTKVEVLEHNMPNNSPESDEHAPKRANICLGCRIL